MANVTTETAVDFAITSLRSAIRDGRLVPGQRLIVADLTRMLSVSAGPVREAVRRLTGEGLVEIVPHRGAAVRNITAVDMHEIYELREALEGYAAALAAQNIGLFDYRVRFEAIMSAMQSAVDQEDRNLFLELNVDFHEMILEAAGNSRLSLLSGQLMLPLYQLRLPDRMDSVVMHVSHAAHLAIVDAILAGDTDRAERSMRAHLAQSAISMVAATAKALPPVRSRNRSRNNRVPNSLA